MRRFVPLVVLLMVSAGLMAQDASLSAPVARNSEAKMTVRSFCASQSAVGIEVSVQDAGNAEIRVQGYTVPDAAHPSATVAGFFTAIGTTRGGETGGVLRRANFRILGFLTDNGYLPASTLNP